MPRLELAASACQRQSVKSGKSPARKKTEAGGKTEDFEKRQERKEEKGGRRYSSPFGRFPSCECIIQLESRRKEGKEKSDGGTECSVTTRCLG